MLAAGAALEDFDAAPRIVPLHFSCAYSEAWGKGMMCLLRHATPQRSLAALRLRKCSPQSAQTSSSDAGRPAAAPHFSVGSMAVCMAARRPWAEPWGA